MRGAGRGRVRGGSEECVEGVAEAVPEGGRGGPIASRGELTVDGELIVGEAILLSPVNCEP